MGGSICKRDFIDNLRGKEFKALLPDPLTWISHCLLHLSLWIFHEQHNWNCPKLNLPSLLRSLINGTNNHPIFQAWSNQDEVLRLLSPKYFCSNSGSHHPLPQFLQVTVYKLATQSVSTIICHRGHHDQEREYPSKLQIPNTEQEGQSRFEDIQVWTHGHFSNLNLTT